MADAEIEKGPGWDWTVFYRHDEEPDIESMVVFGAMTPEAALVEAQFSLGDECSVLGLVRQDVPFSTPVRGFVA